MLPGIIGRKVGMTHIYNEQGRMIPVTVIQAGPVFVTQIKTADSDGYNAVQVGFEQISDRNLTYPKYGHLEKSGVNRNLRVLREFRVEGEAEVELGQEVDASIFETGQKITVTSKSKGRGFAGGVKRHHFKGQHMTHGYMTHRRPLSSGATGPQRVFKGVRKPGHMGDATVTQKGMKVAQVDAERNLVLVTGTVPGPNGCLVIIRKVK